MYHKDFVKLFSRKEGKELAGKYLINGWVLFFIFLITFSVLGFSLGGLDYLKFKMDDPFIKSVELTIPYSRADSITQIIYDLNKNDSLKERFFYKSVLGYFEFSLVFYDGENKGTKSASGRTMESSDPIMAQVLEPTNNLMVGRNFNGVTDVGLIVREKLLKDFNYPPDALFLLMQISALDSSYKLVPIPIIAVVKNLPGKSMFMTTQYFYVNRFIKMDDGNPFDPYKTKKLYLFVEGDKKEASVFKNSLDSYFIKSKKWIDWKPFVSSPNEYNETYRSGYKVVVDFDFDSIHYGILQQLFGQFISDKNYSHFKNVTQLIDVKYNPAKDVEKFDKLSIYFNRLDSVKEFREILAKNYNLELEISQIESRDNYNLVSYLTLILAFVLISFCIVNVCMFISNLLTKHLNKIKMNIGTFMAFGVSENTLEFIYLIIALRFIIVNLLLGFIFSMALGYLGIFKFVLNLISVRTEKGVNYFNLLSIWTVFTIFIVLIISFIVVKFTSKKILNNTPGDLIYNRK